MAPAADTAAADEPPGVEPAPDEDCGEVEPPELLLLQADTTSDVRATLIAAAVKRLSVGRTMEPPGALVEYDVARRLG